MSFLLGLTGSIGMGKTTTAALFAEQGVPVWDADVAVHRLYSAGGAAVGPIEKIAPEVVENDAISRPRLRDKLDTTPEFLKQVEAIVHPLVAQDRDQFIAETDASILVFDMPLLFETGADDWLDAVVVVFVSPEVQKHRVMARGKMTEQQFQFILSRQMPDAEKRAKADYLIETLTLDGAKKQVEQVLADIGQRQHA